MNALIATDFRLYEIGGRLYLNDTTYTTVERYKNVFGKVILCTRVVEKAETNSKLKDATILIDSYITIEKLIDVLLGKNDALIKTSIENTDIVIARVPSIIAYRVSKLAHKFHKPVLALAMGCAWDVYWNYSLLGKFVAPYMFLEMKKVLKNSDYALYVTSSFLQKRYPCDCKLNIGVSDVKIDGVDDRVLEKRIIKIRKKKLNKNISIMTIGDVSSKIKGQKYVVEAMKMLKDEGIIVEYILVGEGDRKYLLNFANNMGVASQLRFTGRLNSDEVIEALDETDIYIQPSLSEGLPRSVIEAMSRACPIIVSKVGGNPELIDSEYIVLPKSSKAIYEKVKEISCEEQMLEQARRNLKKAKEYDNLTLSQKRNEFFETIKADIKLKG